MAAPNKHPKMDISQDLKEAVRRSQWRSVVRLAYSSDCPEEQCHWAIAEFVKRAPTRIIYDDLDLSLLNCTDDLLHVLLPHLLTRGLWKHVGVALQRDISSAQHRTAVEEAMKRAYDDSFIQCILPHCLKEELEQGIGHLVSRGLWRSVVKVLERGILSPEQRGWAVEEAMKHAVDGYFVDYILPHCLNEELEQGITQLVSRRLWRSVSKVLERGIVSSSQRSWAVEEAVKHADEHDFAPFMLHHCAEEELEQVLMHMASRGMWKPVDSATHGSVAEHVLTQIVSRGHWEAVGRFLQRDISSEQHRWAVEEVIRHNPHNYVPIYHVLPYCHNEKLEHVITHLVSQGLWSLLDKVLQRGVVTTQHRRAVTEAARHAGEHIFNDHIRRHCSEDDVVAVFPILVENKKWRCARHMLYDAARDALLTWMTSGHDSTVHDTLFWKFLHHCRVGMSHALDLTKAMTQIKYWSHSIGEISSDLGKRVSWQGALCESLVTSLLHILCSVVCSDNRQHTHSTEHTKQCASDVYSHITACIKDNTDCIQDNTLKTMENKQKWTAVFTEIADSHKSDPLFLLHFLQGSNLYHVSRRGENDDAILLVMLAVFPLFPQLQSVALRMMLRDKRWVVIKKACLSHVWEHDRRRLFKAAVMQRQWSVVRQWSDHTVHDDQREWVMKEAFKEEEWEVYLLLADHGLTMPEQMHAHYMVAKYSDWDTVLQMVERGGDITEVSDLLENWVTGNLRKKPQGDVTVYMKRCEKLIRMRLRFAKEAVLSPMKALERWRWGSVLFNILHEPTDDYFSRVLDKLIVQQEWHILMHLVRLGMNSAERNWLFPEMVRQQHWGVCRMLLEYGVNDQLCVEALPELMERNQWTLVARVMEYNVDDAVRRQVMQCAFHRRAGALFWHCINVMEDKQPLTKETRVKLFNQAISRDMWQAVKPLVEEKDGPGIQRRDMAFLEAIEQHLWDVVDYCQVQGADINMKDENGETPLHREARKREWIAVKEIVLRDGKPNLLDKDGVSVLNRLIDYEQWDTVKIVIMYGGDIHLPASNHEHDYRIHTPLQALITARQADIIQFSIMWCGDQKKGLNDRGETCFHAVCDSDRWWDVMEDLIVRKVDPLAVTKTGQSPLVYAVLNTKCPGRMVAECSRLGFSSHQPSVNGPQVSLLHDIISTVVGMLDYTDFAQFCNHLRSSVITSPLVCAVLLDSPVLVHMLYESASCSKTELVALYTQLPKLAEPNTKEGRTLYEEVRREMSFSWRASRADRCLQRYTGLTHVLQKFTPFLRELLMTPRTLRSSCRLLILQHFHFRDTKRLQCLDVLPLSEPLKNYLEFSDLCDPDYGSDILW